MLHLRRRIALGVDVADLLQLQRALERHRKADAAPEVQEVAAVAIGVRDRAHLRLERQHATDEAGQLGEAAPDLLPGLDGQPPLPPQIQPQQRQRGDLRRECLRRGDADLRTRVQVDPAVGFARNRAPHDVDQAQHAGAGRPRGAHGLERVGGLSRLGNRHRERPRQGELGTVPVLRRVLDGHRNAGQRLDDVATDQPRVPRGPARDDHDALQVGARLGGKVEAVESRHPVLEQQPPPQRAPHRVRLLADLLQHVMRVSAQLDRCEVPGDVVHGAELHVRVAVHDVIAVRCEDRDVAVVQIHHRARVLENGRRVGRHEKLLVAHPQQHGRPLPGHHDLPRLVRGDDGQPVRADYAFQRRDHPRFEAAAGGFLDQMGECLGVGLGLEAVAAVRQGRPQRVGVLDDPVVDQRDTPVTIDVRMRVALRGRPVRRPARVRNAGRSLDRTARHERLERVHAAREFARHHAAVDLHGEPRRVVTPVLQATEPAEQDRRRFAAPGVADDAAHVRRLSDAPLPGAAAPGR